VAVCDARHICHKVSHLLYRSDVGVKKLIPALIDQRHSGKTFLLS
jgi:hypothetical protein